MSAPMTQEDDTRQLEQGMINSLRTASIERRQREAKEAETKCAEKTSCEGESALTPKIREEVYSMHILGDNWYEINELKVLNYFPTQDTQPDKAFGVTTLASEEFKALITHFSSRSVPGDGFCLIRSVEALIGERYKYIEKLPTRLEQTKKLKEIIDRGEPNPAIIISNLGQSDNYAEQLNIAGGFENNPKQGDFSALDFNWVYLMAAKEDVRIVVFINSASNKDMKHMIVYPLVKSFIKKNI